MTELERRAHPGRKGIEERVEERQILLRFGGS
jgi:hypothetical protein